VITAVMLVALIGLAALAIDIGSFYQAQRQAQAAADAGALAGADALGGGASAASVTTTATTLANTNYPSSTAPTATVNGTSVTVNVANTAPTYFGQIFGITKENVGARAVASAPVNTNCSTPGSTCDAIFAMDSNCADNAITATRGSINVTGGVHSNGSIDDSSGGSTWSGPVTNGPAASGCTTNHNVNQETIQNGPTSGPVISNWPIDYSRLYPACNASGPVPCTGPADAKGIGTPSYCTVSGPSFTFTSQPSPGIYCAYGTGDPRDPNTYNGAVAFNNGGFDVVGTFIAGTISVNAGINKLLPYTAVNPTNHLIFYAASTSSTAVNYAAGGYPISGDTFAPNGTIAVTAGINSTSFFEAQDVNLGAGGYTITGDGPPDTSGSSGGLAALTQ
jgi:hypothetical protein